MSIDKDLQEIISTLSHGTRAIIEAEKDGFQITDLFSLIPVFQEIPEAIKDADHALTYLKDMTPEKEDEVVTAVMAELQDTSESTKSLITYLLRSLCNLYMMYLSIHAKANPA